MKEYGGIDEVAPEEESYFCLEVYLGELQTQSFNGDGRLPTVSLSLLDFEPIIFEPSQPRSSSSAINKEGGEGEPQDAPSCLRSFAFRRGKSCTFLAEAEGLASALRSGGVLSLMVVSRVTEHQAVLYGSCAVDLSSLGPYDSCIPVPRLLSSWGRMHETLAARDYNGGVVATMELALSLSCLRGGINNSPFFPIQQASAPFEVNDGAACGDVPIRGTPSSPTMAAKPTTVSTVHDGKRVGVIAAGRDTVVRSEAAAVVNHKAHDHPLRQEPACSDHSAQEARDVAKEGMTAARGLVGEGIHGAMSGAKRPGKSTWRAAGAGDLVHDSNDGSSNVVHERCASGQGTLVFRFDPRTRTLREVVVSSPKRAKPAIEPVDGAPPDVPPAEAEAASSNPITAPVHIATEETVALLSTQTNQNPVAITVADDTGISSPKKIRYTDERWNMRQRSGTAASSVPSLTRALSPEEGTKGAGDGCKLVEVGEDLTLLNQTGGPHGVGGGVPMAVDSWGSETHAEPETIEENVVLIGEYTTGDAPPGNSSLPGNNQPLTSWTPDVPCVEARAAGYSGAATVRSRKGPGTKVTGCSGTTKDLRRNSRFTPARSIRPESQPLTVTRKKQQRAQGGDCKVLKQEKYSKNQYKSHANRNAIAVSYESFSTASCRRSQSSVKPPPPPDGMGDKKNIRKMSVVDSIKGNRQAKGTGERRPWGAGPRLASRVGNDFPTLNSSGGTTPPTAPNMRRRSSLPTELKKPRRGRCGGRCHHIGPPASTATESSPFCRQQRQTLTRPKPSTDFRASEASAADIRLFLPTWGALVADGAWSCGSCVGVGGNVAGSGGGDGKLSHTDNKTFYALDGNTCRQVKQSLPVRGHDNSNRAGHYASKRATMDTREKVGVYSGKAHQRPTHGLSPKGSQLPDPEVERLLVEWIDARLDRCDDPAQPSEQHTGASPRRNRAGSGDNAPAKVEQQATSRERNMGESPKQARRGQATMQSFLDVLHALAARVSKVVGDVLTALLKEELATWQASASPTATEATEVVARNGRDVWHVDCGPTNDGEDADRADVSRGVDGVGGGGRVPGNNAAHLRTDEGCRSASEPNRHATASQLLCQRTKTRQQQQNLTNETVDAEPNCTKNLIGAHHNHLKADMRGADSNVSPFTRHLGEFSPRSRYLRQPSCTTITNAEPPRSSRDQCRSKTVPAAAPSPCPASPRAMSSLLQILPEKRPAWPRVPPPPLTERNTDIIGGEHTSSNLVVDSLTVAAPGSPTGYRHERRTGMLDSHSPRTARWLDRNGNQGLVREPKESAVNEDGRVEDKVTFNARDETTLSPTENAPIDRAPNSSRHSKTLGGSTSSRQRLRGSTASEWNGIESRGGIDSSNDDVVKNVWSHVAVKYARGNSAQHQNDIDEDALCLLEVEEYESDFEVEEE